MSVPGFIWKRWGAWAAHAYDGDRQLCRTAHGHWKAGQNGTLRVCEVGPHGLPYGRVCTHCERAVRARTAAA